VARRGASDVAAQDVNDSDCVDHGPDLPESFFVRSAIR